MVVRVSANIVSKHTPILSHLHKRPPHSNTTDVCSVHDVGRLTHPSAVVFENHDFREQERTRKVDGPRTHTHTHTHTHTNDTQTSPSPGRRRNALHATHLA